MHEPQHLQIKGGTSGGCQLRASPGQHDGSGNGEGQPPGTESFQPITSQAKLGSHQLFPKVFSR